MEAKGWCGPFPKDSYSFAFALRLVLNLDLFAHYME